MSLRPRQKPSSSAALLRSTTRGNTLGVAPTGAGKTIMLSAVVGEMIGERRQGLRPGASRRADRPEPRQVPARQCRAFPPRWSTPTRSPGAARSPSPWCRRWRATAISTAMPRLDLLVIDEAHHAVADSYRRIIDRALHAQSRCAGSSGSPPRRTAATRRVCARSSTTSPTRSGSGELIASGHLVPPRTFVIDVGVQDELPRCAAAADDFDMAEVDAHHGPVAGHRRGDPPLEGEGRRPPDRGVLLDRRPRRNMSPPLSTRRAFQQC